MAETANGSGIGQPVRRREDLRLVRGNGRYTADENLPGQVYAVMVRSPHAHARIRSIATADAKAAPGVLAVLTGADFAADGLKPIPHKPWSPHQKEAQLRRIIHCRPTKRVSSAKRWRWSLPKPCTRRKTAPNAWRSITTSCRRWSKPFPPRGRMRRGCTTAHNRTSASMASLAMPRRPTPLLPAPPT
jgi:hypothetical protein